MIEYILDWDGLGGRLGNENREWGRIYGSELGTDITDGIYTMYDKKTEIRYEVIFS